MEEDVCRYLALAADPVWTDVCRPVVGANHPLTLRPVHPSHGLPTRSYPLSACVVCFTGQRTCMPNLFPLEIHASARRNALSKFTMPAMSPTMTEGGIAQWKVKEGQKYATGDVLLEIVRIPFTILLRVVPLMFRTRKRTKLPSM